MKGARILIVDDDRTTRHVLRRILEGEGCTIRAVGDGMQALDALRRSRFDLVLLDLWMPRMTGLDLLAKIRTRRKRPRVVVMTSDDTPETLLKAVRAQAFAYLQKPVEPPVLIETIGRTLAAADLPEIEVVSARPEWIELLVPCTREAAERLQGVMAQLDAHLDESVRESVAYAFRELLLNAVEWGGKLDPGRQVRIACLRSKRMLLYRIADPGPGFSIDALPHAAIGQGADAPPTAHVEVREAKGLRPGGFGLLTVQASVDELLYNEKRNEVVFVKYLDNKTSAPAKSEKLA